MNTKICSRCKTEKSVEAFAKRSGCKGGRQSMCRDCRKEAYAKIYELDLSIQEKTCSRCGETKDIERFPKNRAMIGGYHWWCKECSNADNRDGYHGDIEKSRKKGREKADRMKPHRRVYGQKWYTENTESNLNRGRKWRKDHPDEARAIVQARRSRENGLVADLSAAQWQEILSAFNHCCAYCGEKSTRLTQDHITPVIKGGEYTLHNIVPACKSCNSKKNKNHAPRPVQPLLLTIAPSKKKKE